MCADGKRKITTNNWYKNDINNADLLTLIYLNLLGSFGISHIRKPIIIIAKQEILMEAWVLPMLTALI